MTIWAMDAPRMDMLHNVAVASLANSIASFCHKSQGRCPTNIKTWPDARGCDMKILQKVLPSGNHTQNAIENGFL